MFVYVDDLIVVEYDNVEFQRMLLNNSFFSRNQRHKRYNNRRVLLHNELVLHLPIPECFDSVLPVLPVLPILPVLPVFVF